MVLFTLFRNQGTLVQLRSMVSQLSTQGGLHQIVKYAKRQITCFCNCVTKTFVVPTLNFDFVLF